MMEDIQKDIQKLPTWFKRHKPYEQKRERHNVATSRISISFIPTSEDLQKEEVALRSDFFMHCCNVVDNLLEGSTNLVHDLVLQKAISFLCAKSFRNHLDMEFSPDMNYSARPAAESVSNDHETLRKCERMELGRGQEENDRKPAKRQKIFSSTDAAKITSLGLLPCCILHSNSTAILDRSYLVQHLIQHKIRSKSSGAKVCLLSTQHSMEFSSSFTTQNRETTSKEVFPRMTLADLLKRFAFELLSSDFTQNNKFKSETCYLWFVKKIKTVSIRECMELITHWARNTTLFDCIVVVIEDIESISPLVLDEFIRCLVHLRLECLVPVSLLIFTCRYALGGLPCTITNGSMHQVELKESSLSFPSAVIEAIMAKIVFSNGNPWTDTTGVGMIKLIFLLSGNFHRLYLSYRDFHGSFVHFILHLKIQLAQFFSHRGSFALALNCPEFLQRHEVRIARCISFLSTDEDFLSDISKGRKSLGAPKLKMKDWKLCAVQFFKIEQLLSIVFSFLKIGSRILSIDFSGDCSLLFEVLCIFSGQSKNCIRVGTFLNEVKNSKPTQLLEIFYAWRNELSQRKTFFPDMIESCRTLEEDGIINFEEIFDKLDELIIIIHEMLTNRVDLKEYVHSECASWFYELIKSCDANSMCRSEKNVDNSIPCKGLLEYIQKSIISSYPESSVEAQPRRIIASALTLPQLILKCECCHGVDCNGDHVQGTMQDSCIAFKTLKSRKTSCPEWFSLFVDSVRSGSPSNDQVDDWIRFAFSVFELSLCGLVQKVDDSVEKAAMVWANG